MPHPRSSGGTGPMTAARTSVLARLPPRLEGLTTAARSQSREAGRSGQTVYKLMQVTICALVGIKTMNTTTTSTTGRIWPAALWAAQVLLAVMFGIAGVMKSTQPITALSGTVPWSTDVPEALVRFIGISELAGAVGLILPALTRIRPGLTPLAALGLVVVMLLASGFHILRGELGALPITFLLGGLAAFVAWGRWTKAPIAPSSFRPTQ